MKTKFYLIIMILVSVVIFSGCEKSVFVQPFTPSFGYMGMETKFEPNTDGISYEWDFGDHYDKVNNTSTLTSPVHRYNFPGMYTVTLFVNTGNETKKYRMAVEIK
ncbi:MAG: PKD domain-containing protein [Bacteroidota bacterium]